MTTDDLTAALRACAAGLYPLEAGTALIISNGAFLHRHDFTSRFIEHGTSGGTPMAAIDWDAATAALARGDLPCSGGERRIFQLSASLAAGIPVDLRDAITGLEDDNTARLLVAIRHAAGKRPENIGQENHVTGLEARDRDGLAEASSTPVPKLDESLVVLIRANLDDRP
jgi:hypothetical protein